MNEDCRELLKWYEQKWLDDRATWEKEKKGLEALLENCAEENLHLRKAVSQVEALRAEKAALTRQLEQMAPCKKKLEEALAEISRLKSVIEAERRRADGLHRQLQAVPLSEGFFRKLRSLELLDGDLLKTLEDQDRDGFCQRIRELSEERSSALANGLDGRVPRKGFDWKRLYTGLFLEWALLAWIEEVYAD